MGATRASAGEVKQTGEVKPQFSSTISSGGGGSGGGGGGGSTSTASGTSAAVSEMVALTSLPPIVFTKGAQVGKRTRATLSQCTRS